MDPMKGLPQNFMLLEDCQGSILNKSVFGAMKSAVTRSSSFQAVRGMLFEFKPDGPGVGDTLDVISCENTDHYLESCPLRNLKLLSEREFWNS